MVSLLLGLCGCGLNLVQNLLIFREPPDFLLAPDLLAVHVNIEDAAGAFDELGLDAVGLLDRSRQTGGLGQIVSLRAILDGDGHHEPLFISEPPARSRGPCVAARRSRSGFGFARVPPQRICRSRTSGSVNQVSWSSGIRRLSGPCRAASATVQSPQPRSYPRALDADDRPAPAPSDP